MQGFLNLNKAFGWTSHDCVAKVRKILRLKKVGHAGTLDPAATGVLPIAIGKATRLLQYLPGDKAYHATIRFGITTTTDDLQGEIIASQPCSDLNLQSITAFLPQFIGKIEQIPPSYSAIQVDGKRLYDLARQGVAVAAPVRTVEVFNIDILDWRAGEFPELELAIACGAGTYIRAIARDLGAVLQTGGTLAALQRTFSSGFNVTNSITIEELETQLQTGNFQVIKPDLPLQYLPSLSLSAEHGKKWCQGQKIVDAIPKVSEAIDISNLSSPYLRIYSQDSCFLGISAFTENLLIPAMVFEPIS
ncbi:tRNA pseudouridine synthase B [Calothrix sp. NIES-4101]|nr:tRNA pseudouridine synthase B [Calothrix sp. NIES-4101]